MQNIIGCSIDFLKIHIASQFQPGMTWGNHGLFGWHIDHIKPLCSFNLLDEKELKEAWNYKNLQPLWAKQNLDKRDHVNYSVEKFGTAEVSRDEITRK